MEKIWESQPDHIVSKSDKEVSYKMTALTVGLQVIRNSWKSDYTAIIMQLYDWLCTFYDADNITN